jgi:hypothetical protein
MVRWATGGPQKAASRWRTLNLEITGKEWEAFLYDFQQTLDRSAVPDKEQAELKAIVNITRSDILVAFGAEVA